MPILKHIVSEWDEFTKQYRSFNNPSLNLISHLATLFLFTAHQFCFLIAENANIFIYLFLSVLGSLCSPASFPEQLYPSEMLLSGSHLPVS